MELFIRKARGLELTSGGIYFLAHAQQILDKVETTVADTRRIALNRKTIFSIGFVPSVFYGQLPSWCGACGRTRTWRSSSMS